MKRRDRIFYLHRKGYAPSHIAEQMRISVAMVNFHLNEFSALERRTQRKYDRCQEKWGGCVPSDVRVRRWVPSLGDCELPECRRCRVPIVGKKVRAGVWTINKKVAA